MLLTKASEYALLSLLYLSDKKQPVDAEQISSQLGISKSFLAKILQKLTKKEILNSYKGVGGGFALEKPASDISILDIINAVEDTPATVFECTGSSVNCSSGMIASCAVFPTLSNLQRNINDFLSGVTLEEIMVR